MPYKIVARNRFASDLAGVLSFLNRTAGPSTRISFSHALRKKLTLLETTPHAFPLDETVSQATGRSVRKLRVRPCKVFYLVDDQEKTVNLLTLVHERQDSSSYHLENID